MNFVREFKAFTVCERPGVVCDQPEPVSHSIFFLIRSWLVGDHATALTGGGGWLADDFWRITAEGSYIYVCCWTQDQAATFAGY